MKKKQSNRKEHSYRLLMTKTQPISLTRATTFHILLRKGEFGSFDGGHQQITEKKTKKLVFQVKKKTIKQKSAYVPTPYGQDAAGNLVDCHVGCGVE
jgi:hypothetical protein